MAARNRLVFAVALLGLLSACCSGKYCEVESSLERVDSNARAAQFSALAPADQVGLYLWQLKRSHPPHSEYGDLIVKNQASTAVPLLANIAEEKDPVIVHIGLLAISQMSVNTVESLSPQRLRSSLEKCRNAFDSDGVGQPFCSFRTIETVLQETDR